MPQEPFESEDTLAEEYASDLNATWDSGVAPQSGDNDVPGAGDNGVGQEAEHSPPSPLSPAPLAPEHWSAEDRGALDALPEEARALYLDKVKSLEAGYNRKFEQVAADRRNYETISEAFAASGIEDMEEFARKAYASNQFNLDEVLEPYAGQLQEADISPASYIERLIQVSQSIQAHPRETLLWLAEQHGVDLVKDATAQVQEASLQREWATFEADNVGAAGLKRHVGQYLVDNPPGQHEPISAALRRAYDQVKMIDPGVRAQAERSRQVEQQRKADIRKAYSSGRTVKSKTSPSHDTRAPRDSWRAELEANWNE